MQAMRGVVILVIIVMGLSTLWQWIENRRPNFTGISDAAAIPAIIQPIELAEIEQRIQSSPVTVLFFYASWCPYCHQQIQTLGQSNTQNLLAISIDQQPKKLAKFVSQYEQINGSYPFPARIYQGGTELAQYLLSKGARFSGSIPYFAIFQQGNLVKQYRGLTPTDQLPMY